MVGTVGLMFIFCNALRPKPHTNILLTILLPLFLPQVQINATMLVVLVGTVILHLLDLILLLVSTSVNVSMNVYCTLYPIVVCTSV